MRYDDENNPNRIQALTDLSRPLARAIQEWNTKNHALQDVFSAGRLLPLSVPFEGGEVGLFKEGISIGEAQGIALLLGWYKRQDRSSDNHPKVTHPEWADSIGRVQEYIEAEINDGNRRGDRVSAPWVVLTKKSQTPLLNDLPLHSGYSENKEGLLPHRTGWSQSLYLAGRFKERSLFAWINKKYPEWLDANGSMVPRSDVEKKAELTPQQAMELDYVISELAHLRDLEGLGTLFLEDHIKGEEFYCRLGMNDTAETEGGFSGSRLAWNSKSLEQQAALRRWNSLTPDISAANWVDRDCDFANVASKAQLIMAMAKDKGQPVEEALYVDPKTKDTKQALMFRSNWMTQERLQMLEGWLAQYHSHGVEQDKRDYQDLLIRQGMDEPTAMKHAQTAFEERVTPALAETFGILSALQDAQKHTITDRVHDFICEDSNTGTSTFQRADMEIFGCSVDDSRFHEQLIGAMKQACAHGQPWQTKRGYDYAILDLVSERAAILGHLGQDKLRHSSPKAPLIPITAPIDRTIRQYEKDTRALTEALEQQAESMKEIKKTAQTLRDEARSQYESRLRVVEMLYTEQAKYLHLSAHLLGYALPKIKEPNPRYEGLKKINKDPNGEVEPFIVYEAGEEMQPMLELYYPECDSISIDEAASIVSALVGTRYAVSATIEGAGNMLESHEEIMQKRQAQGLPTYGWSREYKDRMEKHFAKQYGRQQAAEPSSSRPRFI